MNLQVFTAGLRKKLELSQTEIGRRSGVSQSAINKTIAGINKPHLETYAKLAKAFPLEWGNFLKQYPPFKAEIIESIKWMLPQELRTPLEQIADIDSAMYQSIIDVLKFAEQRAEKLPKSYRERYRDRVTEIIARVQRELTEYVVLLDLELKIRQSEKKKVVEVNFRP